MATTSSPTQEQLDALKAFAGLHGRYWKATLRQAWMDGNYEGFEASHLLQQLRNTLGPSWLNRFVLTKSEAANDPELELRRLWNEQGLSLERQEAILADVRAKAAPGATVGPYRLKAIPTE